MIMRLLNCSPTITLTTSLIIILPRYRNDNKSGDLITTALVISVGSQPHSHVPLGFSLGFPICYCYSLLLLLFPHNRHLHLHLMFPFHVNATILPPVQHTTYPSSLSQLT